MALEGGHESSEEKGELLRTLDDSWSEFLSPTGRKFYKNADTQEITWKPPRKLKTATKPENTVSSWSLPATAGDNVGGILRKGILRIAKISNDPSKKKWHKCLAFLTSTHFVYRRKKKLDDCAGKIPLVAAFVRVDNKHSKHKKKTRYCLGTIKDIVLFECKVDIEAEAWYHAIAVIIDSLSRPKSERPRSYIDFGPVGFPISDPCVFTYGFITNEPEKNKEELTSRENSTSRLQIKEKLHEENIKKPAEEETLRSSRRLHESLTGDQKPNLTLTSPKSTENDSSRTSRRLHEIKEDFSSNFDNFTQLPDLITNKTHISSSLQGSGLTQDTPKISPPKIEQEKVEPISIEPLNFKFPAPPGWVVRFDEKTRRYLYENETNLQVWTAAKRADNAIYFYNTLTHETSWLLPSQTVVRLRSHSRKETEI